MHLEPSASVTPINAIVVVAFGVAVQVTHVCMSEGVVGLSEAWAAANNKKSGKPNGEGNEDVVFCWGDRRGIKCHCISECKHAHWASRKFADVYVSAGWQHWVEEQVKTSICKAIHKILTCCDAGVARPRGEG